MHVGEGALWTADELDAFGRVIQEVFANDRGTQRWYDPQTGHLDGVMHGNVAAGAITDPFQLFDYSYYPNGNLSARRIVSGGAQELDVYEYDDINRLVVTRTFSEDENGIFGDPVMTALGYDAFGNIDEHPTAGDIVSTPGGRILTINGRCDAHVRRKRSRHRNADGDDRLRTIRSDANDRRGRGLDRVRAHR